MKFIPCAAAALLLLLFAGSTASGRRAAETCLGRPATIVGTNARDGIQGTEGNDVIAALGGNDVILGNGGDDVICGGDGFDVIFGGSGNDALDGGADSDGLIGGPGDDHIDGGPGVGPFAINDAGYEDAAGSVTVNLATGVATGVGNDTLVNVSGVTGSDFDDTIIGNGTINYLSGGLGNDVLDGGGGDDDVLFDYPVDANLATGTSTGEGTDRLVRIEGLIGSKGADVLVGDDGRNYLAGGGGNDVIKAAGGDDRIKGGEGNDRIEAGSGDDLLNGGPGNDVADGGAGLEDVVDYVPAPRAVHVDLARDREVGDGKDTLTSVDSVRGSEFGDTLIGDAGANDLYGGVGSDRISGGPGADFLGGGGGANRLDPGGGQDYCLQGRAVGCELTGLPQPIPGAPSQPPGARKGSRFTASTVVPDAAPGGRRLSALTPPERRLTLMQTGLLARMGAVWRHTTGAYLLAAGRPTSSAAALAGRTGEFQYLGQPRCLEAQRPHRTSIAPPEQVEPIGRDHQTEMAFWQGRLYRQDPRTGHWREYRRTVWLRGFIAGVDALEGYPIWSTTNDQTMPNEIIVTVPPGRYVWKAQIRWDRSGGDVFDFVEPHTVYGPAKRPAQYCTFK